MAILLLYLLFTFQFLYVGFSLGGEKSSFIGKMLVIIVGSN